MKTPAPLSATILSCGIMAMLTTPALSQVADGVTGVPHLPRGQVAFEDCLGMALHTVGGTVEVVEFKSEEGVPRYEFQIATPNDGPVWNVDCNALTGFVEHIERHVAADSDEFATTATIDQGQADAAALALIPGDIVHREWIINQEGHPIYVIDVQSDAGGEIKVEVRADNGGIHGFNPEYWEIGE